MKTVRKAKNYSRVVQAQLSDANNNRIIGFILLTKRRSFKYILCTVGEKMSK